MCMDQAILRRSGARRIDEVLKVPVKGFSERDLKMVEREGGFGVHKDRFGRFRKYVGVTNDPDNGEKKVAIWREKHRKKQKDAFAREYEQWLERVFEYETSGNHPNVKPSDVKKFERDEKRWRDGDRPIQGND